MLRLEPLVSLEKDIFPKIPREHLLVPPKLAPRSPDNGASATWLNYKGAALSIIGRYNSDTIILSYIGFYDVRPLRVFEARIRPGLVRLRFPNLCADSFAFPVPRNPELRSLEPTISPKLRYEWYIDSVQCSWWAVHSMFKAA